MRANQRRKAIIERLLSSSEPVSGTVLSGELSASRQIIVQDVSVLRAEGYDIISTHSGYVIKSSPHKERIIKVRHTSEETADELMTVVSLGATVVDVFVRHKVYGRLEAKLNIFSERTVKQFMEGINSGKSSELMHVTSGYHNHTLRADSEEILDRVEAALKSKGYTVEAN